MPQALRRLSIRPIPALAASGLIVFAITGFLGYCPGNANTCSANLDFSSIPTFIDSIFLRPWLLFLWLCALVYTLQTAMLAEEKRAWRYSMYVTTTICIVLVGVFDFYGREIISAVEDLLRQLLGQPGLFFRLISDPWLYSLVNFGLILLLGIGVLSRALRLRHERAKAAQQERSDEQSAKGFPAVSDLPEMHELVIGDVLVRSCLVLMLSVALRVDILQTVIPRPNSSLLQDTTLGITAFNHCSVALPGRCDPSLSFLDLIIALLGLVASVALAATFTQDTAERTAAGTAIEPRSAVTAHGVDSPAMPNTPSDTRRPDSTPMGEKRSSPSLNGIGPTVADALIDILVHPFEPVGAGGEGKQSSYDPLAIVRVLVWPLLILIGIFSTGLLARATQQVLHHAPSIIPDIPRVPGAPWIGAFPTDRFLNALMATGAGTLALIGIVLSAGVITNRRAVAARGVDFARRNGFITLVLFGTYSLALWLFQVLLSLFFSLPSGDMRLRAFDPGFLTYLSFALLLWFGLPRLLARFTKQL
jgi:hypothetical protein